MQEILGFEFDDNFTPFSLFNVNQSVSVFVFQLVVAEVTGKEAYLWFTVACGVTAFLCCGATYFFPFREEKANIFSIHSIISRQPSRMHTEQKQTEQLSRTHTEKQERVPTDQQISIYDVD